MMERWIVTAEGRPPMRPFMMIELEEEQWARDLHANMKPARWSNTRIWHYAQGEMKDVTDVTASPAILESDY